MRIDRSTLVFGWLVATLPGITACVLLGHRGVDARMSRTSLRADALGCWALFDQAGQTAQGSLYWAPAVAALRAPRDTAPSASYPMIRLDSTGRPMPSSGRRDYSYWSADSLTDSIRIGAHSGFSGTQFVFALPATGRSRDTLRGRAYEHSDAEANTNRGRATAVRTDCPSP